MGEEFFTNKRKVLVEKYLHLFDFEKIDIQNCITIFRELIRECENDVVISLNEVDFTFFRKIITSPELYVELCTYVNEERLFKDVYVPTNLILCINSLTNNRKNIVIRL